jgi:hypothetical protein
VLQQFREESDHLLHELSHPGHQAERFRKWLRHRDVRLILNLVGGTAVWGLYFSGLHALNSLACRFGWFGVPTEASGLKLTQIAVTILALALISAAAYAAYTLWRTSGTPGTGL